MDKYYTPKIEEFHVGFEYESEEMSKCGSSTEMVKSVINTPRDIINAFDFNDWHSSVRVKYLNKEDIESLGFTQITNDCFDLPIKEYRGRINQEIRLLIGKTVLIYLAMDMKYNDKENLILFTGNIKNKSELKKLLKQLNIYE